MKIIFLLIWLTFVLIGCSASTGSRYEAKVETKSSPKSEEKKEIQEDFDITPYQTEIDIEVPPAAINKVPSDVWYEYSTVSADTSLIISGTTDGYRVQVVSTDDLDEANQVRAQIYEKTTKKEVYIIFEPPFYKVKVGDFTTKSEAENLRFKLNQLGYTDSKVVQETVNVFR